MDAGTARQGDCLPGTSGARTVIAPAYRRARAPPGREPRSHNGTGVPDEPVLAALRPLCNRVHVDQDGADSNFAATGVVSGDRVVVTVSGEVDMSTADAMFRAATRHNTAAATLDLRAVTFFDSAAIHALIRLADRFGAGLEVQPSPQVRRVLEISGLSTQPWLHG
jgi:anti-anti-sigma factor